MTFITNKHDFNQFIRNKLKRQNLKENSDLNLCQTVLIVLINQKKAKIYLKGCELVKCNLSA